ncbi:molybdopterin molybdotransferase MoeA [Brevibacillus composti]|uniref:Molybdopterin molybdenumtransferase n=1 Tax=Brevibacillus composti TaxID=2796470 RepID=A0A7T5JMK3_9BACL|nr:gephyrin-like molybdotransferase Glp [Brevibacillus composti]QQE73453.1 molybdopterin molybdotransferase MoeA [Brevibacillus composti]QUO40535.1 molybdopterin molybdotransferase MoeA [Brevibacillus composti]
MKFFKVKTVSETLSIIAEQFHPFRPPIKLPITEACGMVLAEDVISGEQVPHFARSTVDGFAVRAQDTYGASDSLPAFLDITSRIEMGRAAQVLLKEGQAQAIPTGGMLPAGADSVVMIEHVEEIGELLNVYRQVAPGENVIRAGDDVERGELVMSAGHRLRPQDLGVLSAIGRTEVQVFPRPTIGILSTGDEVVPTEKKELAPGEVRDINSVTVGAIARQHGAIVIQGGIVRDDYELFAARARELFDQVDVLILSGGSSVGTRDFTVQVMQSLGEPGVLVHGVATKPGKPTILAKAGDKPVMGLPGHPVSAQIMFQLLAVPLLERLQGVRARQTDVRLSAKLSRNVASAVGRTDYIRVKLEERADGLWAIPVFGKSGLISTLVESEGIAEIPENKEGVLEGETVKVYLIQ